MKGDKTAKSRKTAAFLRGLKAETRAAWWLRLKGFHIAARRYKTKGGEIDLIARRANLIVIVEVKARPTLREAMEAIGQENEHRITAAADHWLARQPDRERLYLRFDLIAVMPRSWPKHIPAFFTVD